MSMNKYKLPVDISKVLAVQLLISIIPSTVLSAEVDSILEEIIVTAQKRAQSTQDIGMAITAFQADQLETLGYNEVNDLANIVPGLTMAKSFRGPSIYTLRGIGFNTPNMSTTSPVGIYYDEVSYAYPVMSQGLNLDLERVEVLKGPQSTLYGRNTTGGVINNIAAKPSSETISKIKISYGRYQNVRLEGVYGGSLSDSVAVRLALKTEQSGEGWQKSVTHGGKLGKVDRSAARLTFLITPSDSVEVLVTASWWNDKSEPQAAQAIEFFPKAFAQSVPEADWAATLIALNLPTTGITQPFNPTSNEQANWVANTAIPWGGTVGGQNFTQPPRELVNDSSMASLAVRVNWDLENDMTFTSITSYADFDRFDAIDPSGWDVENTLGRAVGGIKSLQQELRISRQSENTYWVAGLFYSSDKLVDQDESWGATLSNVGALRTFGSAFAAAAGASLAEQEDVFWGFRDWVNDTKSDVETRAIFGQLEFPLTNEFNMTFGLRYTEDRLDFEGCSRDQGDNSIAAAWNAFFNGIGIPANVAPGGCVTYLDDIQPSIVSGGAIPFPSQGVSRKSLNEENVSGRIGLDWRASDNTLVYGSISRGFKSGAFPVLDANVATQFEPAVQEKVQAYELGIKSMLRDNLQVNASLYYYDYTNKQIFGAVADIIYRELNRIVNVPKSEIYGAELEINWAATENLAVYVSTSFLQTEIKEYVGFNPFGDVVDFAGAEFNNSPKLQLNAFTSYRFGLGDSLNGRFTVDVEYSDEQQADFEGDNRFHIDAYTLFGARVSIAPNEGKWEAQAYVRNLTDKYYWTNVYLHQDSIARFSGMPRTYGVSLKYKFQ